MKQASTQSLSDLPRVGGFKYARHWIVEESYGLRNGKYVLNHKEHSDFGMSELLPRQDLVPRLSQVIDALGGCDKVILVGHLVAGDMKWLRGLGLDLNLRSLDIALGFQSYYHQLSVMGVARILDTLNLTVSPLRPCLKTCQTFKAGWSKISCFQPHVRFGSGEHCQTEKFTFAFFRSCSIHTYALSFNLKS